MSVLAFDLVSVGLLIAWPHVVHGSDLRLGLNVLLMGLNLHITSTWEIKGRRRLVWEVEYNHEIEEHRSIKPNLACV